MKPIKKITLKEITKSQINPEEMDILYAGIDNDIMLIDYACKSELCTSESKLGIPLCDKNPCENYLCQSHAV